MLPSLPESAIRSITTIRPLRHQGVECMFYLPSWTTCGGRTGGATRRTASTGTRGAGRGDRLLAPVPARAERGEARGVGHRTIRCRTQGCLLVWYELPHDDSHMERRPLRANDAVGNALIRVAQATRSWPSATRQAWKSPYKRAEASADECGHYRACAQAEDLHAVTRGTMICVVLCCQRDNDDRR
jgi:hypothetical protein